MLHFWKSVKLFIERLNALERTSLKVGVYAAGILIGMTVPRRKKLRTGVLAGSVVATTGVLMLNKFFDASDELAAQEE